MNDAGLVSRDESGEDWWKTTVDDGVVGRVFVTQLRWDAKEGVSVMHVSAPVPEATGDYNGLIFDDEGDPAAAADGDADEIANVA